MRKHVRLSFFEVQVEQLGGNWMSGKDRDGGIVSDRLLG